MSRWVVRMIGILMILGFFMIFAHMQRRLMEIQEQQSRRPAPARSR